MAALYAALTGEPPVNALHLVEECDGGRLYRCSDGFVDAMADANELLVRLGDEDAAKKDKASTTFSAQMAESDAASMSAAE